MGIKGKLVLTLTFAANACRGFSQVVRYKTVENGGTGKYSVPAERESKAFQAINQ